MTGVTFDAGGLIALDRDDRRVIALLAHASEIGARVTIPATALAQAMRNPSKQARLSRLIRQPTTTLAALDGPDATSVVVLLEHSTKTHERAHISMLTATARGLRSKPDSIATPCSVNAYGRWRRPPHDLEVPIWYLKLADSSAVS